MLFRLLAVAFGLAVSVTAAMAADFQKFDMAAFEAANKAGRSVLIHVHADWCPTCRAQQGPLKSITESLDFKDVTAFVIDYDGQLEARKLLKVTKQSTIIVYKGGAEVARSTGETKPDALETIARSAL